MKRTVTALATATLTAALLPGGPAHAAKKPARPGDFDGDGRADVATFTRGVKKGELAAGVFSVIYSGTKKRQVISRLSPGLRDLDLSGDTRGGNATADFDRDGYADLATSVFDRASVQIVHGSKKGLSARVTVLPLPEPGEIGLTVGDFDRDGRPDLVVADNKLHYFVYPAAGSGRAPVRHEVPPTDLFDGDPHGMVFAAGDFNGDGFDDLTVHSGGNTFGLRLVRGAPGGLKGDGVLLPLGNSLFPDVAGDLDGDGRDDLFQRGVLDVRYLRGTAKGFRRPLAFTQATPGVPGKATDQDAFGNAIAVGDVNGDGRDDLALGDPREGKGGAVVVLYGSKSGPGAKGAQILTQNTPGVPGRAEKNDLFGGALKLADVNGDGRADLVVGAPGEDGKGRIYVLPSVKGRIKAVKVRQYGPSGIRGGDRFGGLVI